MKPKAQIGAAQPKPVTPPRSAGQTSRSVIQRADDTPKVNVHLSGKSGENPFGHNFLVLENAAKSEYVLVDTGLQNEAYQSLQANRLDTLTGKNNVPYETQVKITNSPPDVSIAQKTVTYPITEQEYELGKQTATSLEKKGQWTSVDNCTEPVKKVMRATGNPTLASSGSLFNTPTGTLVRAQVIRSIRTTPKCIIQ